MDQETVAGTTVGFLLAMIFITHQLVKYEKYLDDRKLAIGFTMGFVSGMLAFLVEQVGIFSFNVEDIAQDSSRAFISIFGIAVLHSALKGMFLNHKSLTEGDDQNIAFYGSLFGFFFGAIYVTVLISKSLKSGDLDGPFEFILLGLLSVGMVLFQGSTSVVMGWAVSKGKLYRYFGIISISHMIMNVFIFLSAVNLIPPFLMVLFILVYGILFYVYCHQHILPTSLTRVQARELRVEMKPSKKRLSRLAKDTTSSATTSHENRPAKNKDSKLQSEKDDNR